MPRSCESQRNVTWSLSPRTRTFADIVTARGGGPKILWLLLGNASTDAIADSIREAAASIGPLLEDPAVQVVQVTGGVDHVV